VVHAQPSRQRGGLVFAPRDPQSNFTGNGEFMRLTGKRVLLVEDCPDQQRIYLQFLLSEGADVTLECDGFAAVRTAKKASMKNQPFDAAVMDLVLAQSDGIRATKSILAETPSVAVIAVTANGNAKIARDWYRAGCMRYFEKPVAKEALIESLVRAIEVRSNFALAAQLSAGLIDAIDSQRDPGNAR
jgi:DNA-binding NtrC family response regulator